MKYGVRVAGVLCLTALAAPAAWAADQDKVDAAVRRAAEYIKSQQGRDGTWSVGGQNAAPPAGPGGRPGGRGPQPANPYASAPQATMGATALCGLALLEAGVPADDPSVQGAARAVREQSILCEGTYSLSLGIMFLDRLGEPADAELIDSMAVRLLAGQDSTTGGWYYDCPPLAADEARRLQAKLGQRARLVAKDPERVRTKGRKDVNHLPAEIRQQVNHIMSRPVVNRFGDDNSNTQFAILALWIARRQGIPVEPALRRIETRFHTTQNQDGGWGYQRPQFPNTRPSMTCSGLLGLALFHGGALEATLRTNLPGKGPASARQPPAHDPSKDAHIQKGLRALGRFLSGPLENLGVAGGTEERAFANAPPGPPGPHSNGMIYYFLFSLERVGVVFGQGRIGGVDWYDKGADFLLKYQKENGAWEGDFAVGCCDTCFSILFLRRSNLVQDLTDELRVHMRGIADVNELPGNNEPGPGPARVERPATNPKAPAATNPSAGPPPADPQIARLSAELVNAAPAKRKEVLDRLRDGKGSEYTDALAYAIHKLDGLVKERARDALVDRMVRFTPKTLGDKLQDDDAEVRRAAALACGLKEDRTNVPRLIELLGDREVTVGYAAHSALKRLAGQELGSGAQSIPEWKKWWNENRDK